MKYKLKEIGNIITGKTPNTSETENFSYNKSKYLFITPRDMNINSKYIKKTERYLTDFVTKKMKHIILEGKSICISCIGSDMGKVYIIDGLSITNQQINSITNINEICNPEYLYYYFKDKKEFFKSIAGGSTMPILKKSDFEDIIVDLPERYIQDKIVKILNSLDEKIELNNQINNNLYEIGNELLKNDFILENEKQTLSQVIKFVKGKKPFNISNNKQVRYEKYLTIACLNGQELNYADTTKMIMSDNDLLMVMDGASSGDVYYGGQGIVGSTLARIDCIDNNYISEFIFFSLKYYKDLIQSKNTGSAIPHTDKVFVGSLEIPKMNIKKQEKYKVLLSKIQHNQNENETLENLRNTLLPKLMNGEIDLNKVEL